jgi:dTDP-4-amino-4,6-dideoxygalactose transaminase
MELRIPLSDLNFDQEEEQAVIDVLNRRWLTMGEVTQNFEAVFAKFLGVRHALAVSNCTQALHLAFLALGIGPGDEVIVPSLTFVASANAVLYTGAKVNFADVISDGELTISPEDIEKKITTRTKAILVMHYAGYPCRMPDILDIANRHGLAIVEDVAHAPGAALDGRMMGTWGEIGCFSFFSNKNIATGEGGMLVTDRDDLAAKVKTLRSHGMTTLTWERHHGHAYSYDVTDLGYNYRIDEIRSALGLVQLKKLPRNNVCRQRITQAYWKGLKGPGYLGVGTPFEGVAGESAYHIFPILLPPENDRKLFMDALRNSGVQTSIHYPPIHKFSYYQSCYPGVSLPVTESVASREVTLPLYPSMSSDDVAYVLQAIRDGLSQSVIDHPEKIDVNHAL